MGISLKDLAAVQARLKGRRSQGSPDIPAAGQSVHRRFLGIDPSLRGTGLGVVEVEGQRLVLQGFETVECPATWSRSRCLGRIHAAVTAFIQSHRPEVCAVEGLFFAQNLKTALIMGEARGASLAAVAAAGLPIYEIAPRRVKLAIVGFGGAQKEAVARMIQRLLGLEEPPPADAADALAVALALAQELRRPGLNALKPV